MNKWIAEFELEDGDTMPEHMDLEYKRARIGFHCRPMWIPVSERLPEDKQLILVTRKNGMIGYITWNTWLHEQTRYSANKVIAWMPLPEPYKEEGAE